MILKGQRVSSGFENTVRDDFEFATQVRGKAVLAIPAIKRRVDRREITK